MDETIFLRVDWETVRVSRVNCGIGPLWSLCHVLPEVVNSLWVDSEVPEVCLGQTKRYMCWAGCRSSCPNFTFCALLIRLE